VEAQVKVTMKKSNTKAEQLRDYGNDFFTNGEFCQALLAYNFSLCFAKTDTEALGLAYANRSAVYFQLQEYQLCIQNIELAKAHKYPLEKIQKLEQRKKSARRLIVAGQHKVGDEGAKFFKMSYAPNPKHPFLAECLDFQEDKDIGKCIITTRDLKPGDVIALIEPAFSLFDNRARLHHCSNCQKNSMILSLIPCPGCVNGTII
jgi:SET and MYND domain-containing protein 4